MIYNLGLLLGLTVTDIDKMTAGEVIDLAYYKANQEQARRERKADDSRTATQADYDNF